MIDDPHWYSNYDGPYKTEQYKCGGCGEMIDTHWAYNEHNQNIGLLRGPYVLLGDVVFHEKCCDDLLAQYPPGNVSKDD